MPDLNEPELRDRYRWSQMLILLALGTLTTPPPGLLVPLLEHADLESRPARMFRDIARMSGQSDLIAAIDSVNDRLAYARVVEVKLGIVTIDELTAFLHVIDSGTARARRAEITRYHRRRMQQCGRIVEAIYRGPTYDRQ